MKLKNLKKKIRRLEKRLREGPERLAKLKTKLEAMEKAKATKTRKKSAARARPAGQTAKVLTPIQKKGAGKKTKRKLNLSPERRVQLAEAMKARWAAKRSAAETVGEASQPMESGSSGV
jgi:chromosome segregation ATPase